MLTIPIKVNEDEYVNIQKRAARNNLTPSDEIHRQLNLDPLEIEIDKCWKSSANKEISKVIGVGRKIKQIGFLGMSNIPLYETTCAGCGKIINTTFPIKENYCLECKPFQ